MTQYDNNNKKRLYDALSNDYNLGSFEQFSTDLDDDIKRRKLYDATVNDFAFGDYASFSKQLGYDTKSEQREDEQPRYTETKPNENIVVSDDIQTMPSESTEVIMPVQPQPLEHIQTTPSTEKTQQDINRKQVEEMTEHVDDALNEKVKESQRRYEERRKGKGFWESFKQGLADLRGGVNSSMARMQFEQNNGMGDFELQQDIASLDAAKQAMTNAQRLINEADHNAKEGTFESSFLAGVGRGIGQHLFDARQYDAGMSDAAQNAAFIRALDKFDNGEELSDAEKDMLDAKAIEMATQAYFGSYIGRGYIAGSVTAESVPFMLDMMINPASSVGKSAGSKLTRYALNKYGKAAVKKNAKKYLATKASTRMVADLGAAAAMSATTGAIDVTADALDRMGGITYETNADGKTVFGDVVKKEDFAPALAKAYLARTIENHSEMVGEYFDPIVSGVGKGISKGLSKIGLDKVNNFIEDVSMNDIVRLVGDFEKSAKWSGTISEFAEEIVGGVENALLVGDQTLDTDDDTGVFNSDNLLDTFLGVSLMGGFMSSAKTVGYVTSKVKANKVVNEASAIASAEFGKVWDEEAKSNIQNSIKDMNVFGLNNEILKLAKGSPRKLKIILNYAKKYANLVGAEKGEIKRRTEGDMNPIQFVLESAYDAGYKYNTPQEMHDAKLLYEHRKNRLSELLSPEEINEIEQNPSGVMTFIENHGADVDNLVVKFLESKAFLDAMNQRINDTKDELVQSSNAKIDAITNEAGQVIKATTNTDKVVHIIKGNVRPYSDGTGIDLSESDESILIRDEESDKVEVEMVSPSIIFTVESPIDAEQLKQEAANDIITEIDATNNDKINGIATFNPGDSYLIKADDGEVSLQIVPNQEGIIDNGDGTVNVSDGNTIFPVHKQTIQEQFDAYNNERVAIAEQEREKSLKAHLDSEAEKLDTSLHEVPQTIDQAAVLPYKGKYAINDSIVLKDENSNPVSATISLVLGDEGQLEIFTEKPINGQKVLYMTPEELNTSIIEHNGNAVNSEVEVQQETINANPPQKTVAATNTTTAEQTKPSNQVDEHPKSELTALERIPKDENNEPLYEQTDNDTAWDAILEQTNGDESMAQRVVESMVAQKETELKNKETKKIKAGTNVSEMIKAEKERKDAIDAARKELEIWKRIATTSSRRKMEAEAERRRIAEEEAAMRKAEEERDGGRSRVESEDRGNKEEENDETEVIDRSMTADEAQDFIADMELSAEIAPEIDLTIDNWDALFGEDGIVSTPIGNVKMGENQFTKLMRQGRNGKLGMIKPTLEHPHAIIEDASEAKEGDTTERASSYIFIRSFKKADGSRFYYFTSITVSKDGKEVVVSSQEKSRKKILRLLQERNVIWRTPKDATTSSAERQGLDYEQPNKAETATKGSEITPQSIPSDDKVNKLSNNDNSLGEKIKAAEDDENGRQSLLDVVRTLYSKGKEVASTLFQRSFFDVAQTPKFMKELGLRGDKFTIKYGVIARHIGKDSSHNLTEKDWEQLPQALQKPFAISKLTDKDNSYRIYTTLQTASGEFAVVGVDVKNAGREIEVNAVSTVFGRRNNANLPKNEEVIYRSNEITPEQSSLLERPNFAQYPTEQELSEDKDSETSGKANELGEKVAQAEAETDVNPTEKEKEKKETISDNLQKLYNAIDNALEGNRYKEEIYKLIKELSDYELSLAIAYKENRKGRSSNAKESVVSIRRHISSEIKERQDRKDLAKAENDQYEKSLAYFREHEIHNFDFDSYISNQQRQLQDAETEGRLGLAARIKGIIRAIEQVRAELQQKHNNGANDENSGKEYHYRMMQRPFGIGTPTDAAYTITQAQYTTKRGKVLDMHLVKFSHELTKDELRSAKELAKGLKGWYDSKQTGFMMRSEEDAQQLVDAVMDESGETLSDAAPISLKDVRKVNEDSSPAGPSFKEEEKSAETSDTDIQPIGHGAFGDIYDQFKGKAQDAIAFLSEKQGGEAIGALHHKDVGDIDLVWGNEGTGHSDGFGLAKLVQYHPEVLDDLQGLIDDMHVVSRNANRINLESDTHKAAVRLEWDGEKKNWLLTAFEKENSVRDNTTDTDTTVTGKQNDTATLQNTVSDNKDTNIPSNKPNPSGNKLVTDERYEELKRRMKAKLGQLNVGIDPEILAIGTEMAVYHIEKGARKFAEFAKAMIADLGDVVRPYLKAFYNGARDLPEVEDSGLSADMTPYDEVHTFDVANFDKENTDPFATAETVVAEQTIQKQADGVKQEIINNRNKERRKENEQTTADTETIVSEAEAVADKAESDIEDATDEKQLSEIADTLDGQIEKINSQLALLGFYEAEEAKKDFNEMYGYMRNAEKKAVKDANTLAKKLVEDLGINPDTLVDSKGKKLKKFAHANIAPAGGEIYITIPLGNERELEIILLLDPDRQDNLYLRDGYIRIRNLNPQGKEMRWSRNVWINRTETYQSVLKKVQREIKDNVPSFVMPGQQTEKIAAEQMQELLQQVESGDSPFTVTPEVEKELAERNAEKKSSTPFKVGDKVMYKGEEATIYDIDNGRPVLDTGLAPVMYEMAEWDDLSPVTQTTENKQPKKSTKKKKSVSSHTEVDDLFSDLFDNDTLNSKENKDGLQRIHEFRSEGLPANSTQGSLSGSLGGNNEEVRQEGRRGTDGSRTDGSERTGGEIPPSNGRLAGRLQGLSGSKNTHNNRGERGKDYAPTSVDARIEANIKAIELAKQLLESGEKATDKQMQTLRKFSGWGGLGKAFSDGTYYAPNPTQKKLRELLGEKAYQEAVMSANSAYYTPAYVVDTLWDIAEKMGFEGGNILEGSAGIGNILGQMPTHISERSDIHAIEIDGTSGGILSLLYPDAKVEIQGFEQTRIPNGSVDLAITNVPFVTGLRVNDTTGDKDLSKKFHNIHDFCIAKNVRKLREGGLGIFITSNGTLDNSKKLRDWIVSEGGADFVGAFRMHNKTFGGTGVTSDIIVIRKRVNGQKSSHAIDVSDVSGERMAEYDTGETRKVKGKETPVIKQLSMDYNRYFIEHPENMAGEMHFAFEKGDTFRPTSKGLYPIRGKKQEEMLAEFVRSFHAEEFGERNTTVVTDVNPGKKIGEVFVKDGKLYINSTASAQLLGVNANKVKGHTKVECFEAYTAIKEALAEVLSYQTENESDDGLKPLLDKLNKAYDDFVSTYGHFNKNTAIAFLRHDVDYANVSSVETYKETGDGKGGIKQTFGKADVMNGRVVEKEKEPTPANVKDGIIASIFKFGRVDIAYIAEQLGKSEGNIKNEIIEGGLGFEDPVSRRIEASYEYLSGNIREKLRQAEENNENGEFDRNIKALQEVIPMEIPAHLIDFTLGSSWIDPKLYEDFVKERTEVDVRFTAVGGTWFMKEPYFTNYEKNRAMGVNSEKLGRTIMGHTLIEAAIQNRSITVSTTRKNRDGSTETITDKEATQACSAKIDEIRQDFKDWARQKMQSDPEMSALIERIYNDTFNNFVPMSIPDDFVPKYFGGASHKFKMRPHQGRAIVRGTMQPLMLAHEVGSGKTFTLISIAMEMRRLGTARKPMIVVQNATIGQFVADAKKLYPNAKILTLEEADRGAEGRKNFYAKIRYNDWDMIIVPQSTFEFIPDSEEREMAFVQDKIEEKMLILEKMKEEDPYGENMITRQAEREIELLEEQLAGLADNASKKRTANDEKKRAVALQNAEVKAMEMLDRRTDDVENFDDMGIDALLVDEAHEYKHLGFATAMKRGVKGVDPSYSKKSQGVFLKTQAVLEKNNGRNVIFATGTPISNTAAEIWTFMRYLMPADTMKEYGIYYFDDFVRNFGNIQQMLEFTTSGKFKENNRFAGYVNLPELVRVWSGVADTVLFKDIEEDRKKQGKPDLRPEIEGGKAQDIYLPQTRALRSIMKFVKSELEHFEQMSGKEKKENSHIPLNMFTIAKAAAVDARLVQADAEDDPNSKTNEAVRQTLRSLKETDDYKGTVAIFADNYQNKQSGFNLYDDIRNKLIAKGIPADEVVVIRSSMSDKKKLETFEKVNRGEVRVILGSTYTLGTGVNIQERLHTLIHIDAPNRPMDYTQRNGRIQRQGNIHKDMGIPVRILRFGVEDSLDVTAYQRLKTKGAIADSIMNGKQVMANSMTNRVLEEEEDVFGDTIAQLSGSEYAMLKNNAEKNVRKYISRKKQWEADQTYIHNAKPRLKAFIKDAEKRIEDNNRYLEAVRSLFPDGQFKEIVIGKHRFTSVEAMDDFFKEHNKSVLAEMKQMKDGKIAGEQKRELAIHIGDFSFVVTTKLTRQTMRDGATLYNDVERKMTYSCPELGIENVPIRQNLLRNAIDDITDNVITGKRFAEKLSVAERSKKHNEAELKELLSREGKPFEFEKELEQAKSQLEEYTELMKKELEEKEAKYAEMDASVETANDIVNVEDSDEETLFRSVDTTKDRIEALFNQAISGEFKGKPISIGRLTDAGKVYLKQISGVTFKDKVDFVLNPSDLVHIYKRHFGNNETDERSIPLDIEDIRSIADVISFPDRIIPVKENAGEKRKMFFFLKGTDNGTYNLLEIYADKKGNLTAKTFYKTKEGVSQRAITLSKSLHTTSETDGATLNEDANIPQIFEVPNIEDNYTRDDFDAYIDDELSFGNAPTAKLYDKSRESNNQRREFAQREHQRMAERVTSLAEKLHLDNVEIVTDTSTLEGKKQRAKGFFNKKTGKITIVIPNNESIHDVEQTLLHEAVAHYGLRKLFGKDFDNFLQDVYQNVTEDVRTNIAVLASKHKWDLLKATEEYLASLAEDTNFDKMNPTAWEKIKQFFADMLRAVGLKDLFAKELSDNELRYILWASYKNLSIDPHDPKGYFKMAEDSVMRHDLGIDDNLYRGDILTTSQMSSGVARDIYEKEVRITNENGEKSYKANLRHRLREAYQDSMISLKKLQEAIVTETGKEISSYEDAYMAENRMSSSNQGQTEAYMRDFMRPLQNEILKLTEAGADYEDIKKYVIAKHGLERNKVFSKRDAEAKGESWDGAVRQDYSGLTELTNSETNFTEIAEDMVNSFESDYPTSGLWDKINAATSESLKKEYESGLMSKQTYENVRNMFEYYIPLRGWDTDVASNEYDYLLSERILLPPGVIKAKGRKSIADDPFATIGYMGQTSIVRSNRNLMKQKLLNLVLNNPTNLVSVSEQWYVKDPATNTWEARNPTIPENATADEVADIISDFNDSMQQLEKDDLARNINEGLNIGKHVTQYEGQEHCIRVKRNGKEYCMYINGNPRAAQAVNGLTNPDISDSSIYKAAKTVKNFMARMFTTRNAAFTISNLARDTIFSGMAVAIKEDAKYRAQYSKNITEAFAKAELPRLIKKLQKGKLDLGNDMDRYFDEFIRNGGETGFTQLNTVENFKRDIQRFLSEAENGVTSIPKKIWRDLWDSIEFMNRCAEDTTRFMVYMTSRQMGRDVSRSIYDAKEITVNFSKKGSGGYGSTILNFCYIFFNASIQSMANFGKLLYHHPVKTSLAITAFATAGIFIPILSCAMAAMFGDDDDYWDLPEWVRRNNLVFYVPWSEGGYITIPLPHELRAFYGMGEIAFSVLCGKESIEDGIKKVGLGYSGMLPIDFTGNGSNIWLNLMPTIGQPFAQAYANTDYFGKPIYRNKEYNKNNPEWTKAYKGTSTWLIDGTKWLNEISGGDKYKSGGANINPAIIEHLVESYFGGAGKTLNRTIKTFSMLWNKDMREWKNVPVVSNFYQKSDEKTSGSQINRDFFRYKQMYEEMRRLLSGYNHDTYNGIFDYAEKLDKIYNSKEYQNIYWLYEDYMPYIKEIQKDIRMATEQGDTQFAKELETELQMIKKELVDAVNQDFNR